MNFNNYDLLEIVEYFAEENDFPYSSEEAVSAAFDQMLDESGFFDIYDKDDSVAISEAFNNWTDGLCKEGDLHSEQYNKYSYVGKYE